VHKRKRHRFILHTLAEQKVVTVQELTSALDASEDIDLVITDDGIDAESKNMLEDSGVKTVVLEVEQSRVA
jgi:DeoR/GlpR family transcriptional regulator of sugar metabolism